jgi:hypothetical protein
MPFILIQCPSPKVDDFIPISGCNTDERNNRFHRFVLLRSYQTRKPALFLQKLGHIHRTGNTNFCVVTEYVRGKFTPRVAPIAEWTHLIKEEGAEWVTTKRKEVHVVRFVEETDITEHFWILRSDSSAPVEALLRIAEQIPLGVDVVGQLEDLYPALFQEVQDIARMKISEKYWYF